MAGPPSGGTGTNLARAVVIVAGVSALVASLLSFVYVRTPSPYLSGDLELTLSVHRRSIWLQTYMRSYPPLANRSLKPGLQEELSKAAPSAICDPHTADVSFSCRLERA